MGKALSTTITDQISAKAVKPVYILNIDGNDRSSYLLSFTLSIDRKFGSNSASFVLNNDDNLFGVGGSYEVKVGDTVELIEKFEGDSTEFKKFYGLVRNVSNSASGSDQRITLVCLDYIGRLKELDIDLLIEGTKVEVEDETLEPVYLPAPNDDMAQLFNFANDGIATAPLPLIKIKDKNHEINDEQQFDGFEVYHDVGQLKLGAPLNVKYNYEVHANYYYYTKGVYIEDAIEQILKLADGYGNYLFGESSASDVVTNHLQDTFTNVTGKSYDTLTPNSSSTTIDIETTLASAVSAGDTSITLTDSTGFPSSGQASINGDVFTWSGKTGNQLTGIPSTGSYALKDHASGDYVVYENTYSAGQVWALTYNNLVTDLTDSDFTLPSGVTIQYVDKRYGRIILDSAVSLSETITCNTDYTFKTLQASGVEINKISFRKREVPNRFEALNKLRQYVAPNYVLKTIGDNKIWAMYLTQKSTADYTLALKTRLNYSEDKDLYTRVVLWAKNENPTNLMFGEDVDYTSDTEDSYTGTASMEELAYFGEEKSGILSEWAQSTLSEAELLNADETELLINYVKDKYIAQDYPHQESTGYYVFASPLTNRGGILLGDTTPIVYINSVPIDNQVHQMVGMPIKVKQTTTTVTHGGGKSKSVSVSTYYYYSVIFPHSSIVPDEPIYLYDNQGLLQYTISPNDPNVDYGNGVWTIPGTERNDVAEVLATATYKVLYSTDKLTIDYDDAIFKIHSSILPYPDQASVKATFEYWAIAVSVRDIQHVVDGRRDTQLQLEFFGEPPADFHLATIDLGATYNIQAIDIVGGFYKPDDLRKFDMACRLTMKYSTDGTNFYSISDKTENFSLKSGEAVTFTDKDLGTDLNARYLKFNLQDVDRIPYGRGRYVVALTEISVYDDIVIKSEATLIPTTTLTQSASTGDTTVYVKSTAGFSDSGTAYIGEDPFTYTGKTATTFTGCTISSGVSASVDTRVSQTLEGDSTLYDDDGLLPQLGDRVYHSVKISDRNLYSQSELDTLAKSYLKEFYKNHSKLQAGVLYAPYINIGDTVELVDPTRGVNTNYFVERISDNNGFYTLVLARYP